MCPIRPIDSDLILSLSDLLVKAAEKANGIHQGIEWPDAKRRNDMICPAFDEHAVNQSF